MVCHWDRYHMLSVGPSIHLVNGLTPLSVLARSCLRSWSPCPGMGYHTNVASTDTWVRGQSTPRTTLQLVSLYMYVLYVTHDLRFHSWAPQLAALWEMFRLTDWYPDVSSLMQWTWVGTWGTATGTEQTWCRSLWASSAFAQYMMCTCVYSVWTTHTYHLTLTHVPLFSSHSTDPPIPTSPGLNNLYLATQKNPGTETTLRQQLEQELEMQKSIRQEKEVSYSFFPIIRISLYTIRS